MIAIQRVNTIKNMRITTIRRLRPFIFGWLLLLPVSVHATMSDMLKGLTTNHERTNKTQAKMDAARLRLREAWGDWFPGLDFTATTGGERQSKEAGGDTNLDYRELDIKLSQLLWDFGKTTGKIEKTAQLWEKAKTAHEAAIIKLLMDGSKSILNVIKNREALELAKKAESNIFDQAEMEKNLITAGAGLATDLLQANAQFAAAETRRVRAEGALVKAENDFRKLYKRELQESLEIPPLETRLAAAQPKDLETAIQVAVENNTDVRTARIDLLIAQEDLRQAKGKNFFPNLTFDIDHKWQDNVSGVEGRKNIASAGIKLNMPFNLGLTAFDAVAADHKELTAAENQLTDTLQITEEEVRNAWQELITLRSIAITLTRQAEISAGFLELARQERKLGNRSLLDVLSGETSLINAQSDAAAAKIDVLIGMITLLKATGQLSLDLFVLQGKIQPNR